MANQETNSGKLILISFVVVLGLATAVATQMYRNAQGRQVDEANLQVNEGIAQFRAEQYELSLETLSGIPENTIEDWHIPYYMGSAMIKLKKYEPAALQLEKASALNPNEKNVLFALGVVYYKLGKLSLSKAYFASVLQVDPGHEEAKGLMDVMASLERIQPGATQDDTTQAEGKKEDNH